MKTSQRSFGTQSVACRLFATLSLVSLIACNYNMDKPGGPATDPNANKQLDPNNKANLNFNNVLQNAIGPNCLDCHSSPRNAAGINLETYENVFTNKGAVMGAVQSASMPKGRMMPTSQKNLLMAWLEAGAARDAAGVGSQPQTPQNSNNTDEMDPSKPANLTFANVYKNVITKSCFACHQAPANKASVNLETYESTFGNRHAIASAIESGSMPVNRVFPGEQRTLILAWLAAGAPRGIGAESTPPSRTPVPTIPCDDHRFVGSGGNDDERCKHPHPDNH
jgi:uncharacterized membrane protein